MLCKLEVVGSIPIGSTSLRSLRELRLGKPAVSRPQRRKLRAEVPKELGELGKQSSFDGNISLECVQSRSHAFAYPRPIL